MVSEATGISPSTLRALIAKETHAAELGFLGSSYIVVLQPERGPRQTALSSWTEVAKRGPPLSSVGTALLPYRLPLGRRVPGPLTAP